MSFTIDQQIIQDRLHIKLAGDINEDVTLPDLELQGIKKIEFDFKDVDLINSCGIREWLNWLKKVTTQPEIEFNNCPPIIIDQVNMISGFIPDGGKILSFYVPYYSEDQDKVHLQLFQKGKDFQDKNFEAPESLKIPELGDTEAEIDVIPKKYFKFLENFV